jgi:dipeptidyl-peptidase 4
MLDARRYRRSRLFAVVPALAAAALLAQPRATAQQPRALTIDALYHPEKKVDFTAPRAMLTWLDDDYYIAQGGRAAGSPSGGTGNAAKGGSNSSEAQAYRIDKIHAVTGKSEPWFDASKLTAALARVPGVTAEDAKRLGRPRLANFNPARTGILITIPDDLYYYDIAADRLTRLTHAAGEEQEATFSPDGKMVAFVRDYNLHVADVATGTERALTTDGKAAPNGEGIILNGKLDWVYQEEIYGRGSFKAYWWSPDSTRLAFLQLDETPVHEFTVVDHIPYRQELETFDYPKAGDPNPKVKLGAVRVTGGDVAWVDLDTYSASDFLIVDVTWQPDSRAVVYQVQDREQTWLDLNAAAITSETPKRLIHEASKAWVNRFDDNVTWLKDGSFIWQSERTGFKHLYHYKADGTLLKQITDGRWEARTVHGVDNANGLVYFSGTERSPIGSDVYRVKLDGMELKRLSETPGTHSVRFNPSFTRYFDDASDAATPTQTRLHAADGSQVRVIEEGKIPALADYRLSKPEFLQVKTRDGFVMEAMMIKPPDFDPSRKYPVLQQTYAGPHAQTVRNGWSGTGGLYNQLLAQKGVIVWACDNRTASGKGVESTHQVYRRFGELELRDIEDCLAWLKKQPYVDGARIGINGWSYGGFMVSYALTHSKSFAMGIAGGSVTDFRDYDSIYTERYMGLPQRNPDGYKSSSPRFFAKDLSGKILLLHGLIDENVHVQNTIQFAYELQKAGKPFELMLYPKQRHGIVDPALVHHMRSLMLDFTMRTLTPSGATAPTPTASQ